MPDRMLEAMSDRRSVQQIDCEIECQIECRKERSGKFPKYMSLRMPTCMANEMPERNVPDRMLKYMSGERT